MIDVIFGFYTGVNLGIILIEVCDTIVLRFIEVIIPQNNAS